MARTTHDCCLPCRLRTSAHLNSAPLNRRIAI